MIRIQDNQSKKIADSFDDYFGSRSENYINLIDQRIPLPEGKKIETFLVHRNNSCPSTKGTKSCYYWSKAFSSKIESIIILVNEFGDKKPQNVDSFNTKSMASDVPVEILK